MPGENQGGFKTPQQAIASLAPLAKRMQAAADKTPSVVVAALEPEPLTHAQFTFPPINSRTWLRLEKIKSPFAVGPRLDEKGKAVDPTFQEIFSAFYVITMPPDEVRQALAGGTEKFDAAVEEFAALLPLSALPGLSEIIAVHLAREFDPSADLAPPEREGSGTGPLAPGASSSVSATAPAPS
jgi:hypothetical protein